MGTTTMHGAKPGHVSPDINNANDKARATLTAELALKGHKVHNGDRGDFSVCKHGLIKYCMNLAELQAFAEKLGVKQ